MARCEPGVEVWAGWCVVSGVDSAQTPDTRPGCYYVSVKRDDGRYALLLGPLTTHAEALEKVRAVREKACEVDPRGVWYAYGTARLPDDDSVPIRAGKLNKEFGLPA